MQLQKAFPWAKLLRSSHHNMQTDPAVLSVKIIRENMKLYVEGVASANISPNCGPPLGQPILNIFCSFDDLTDVIKSAKFYIDRWGRVVRWVLVLGVPVGKRGRA